MTGRGSGWSRIVLVGALVLTAGATSVVLFDLMPLGVPGEWVWARVARPDWVSAAPAALVGILLVGCFYLLGGRGSVAAEALLLVLVVLLAFALQVAVGAVGVGGVGLQESAVVTLVPWIGGYYLEAYRIQDVREFLAGYARHIESIAVNDPFLGHISDHPPGGILFFWAVRRMLGQWPWLSAQVVRIIDISVIGGVRLPLDLSAVGYPALGTTDYAAVWTSALLLRMLAALAIPFCYGMARLLYERRTALRAAALAALVPGALLFSPMTDQIGFFLASVLCFLCVLAWRKGSVGAAILAGVVFYFAMQLSIAFAATAFLGLASVALWWVSGFKRHKPQCVSHAPGSTHKLSKFSIVAAIFVGFLLPLMGGIVAFRYDALRVWGLCYSKHASFASVFPRTYWKWLVYNPAELASFMGTGTFVLMVGAFVVRLRRAHTMRYLLEAPLLLSVLLTFAFLILSGKNAGEGGRLWMFLMPLAAVAAGEVEEPSRSGKMMFSALLFLQLGQVIVYKLYLDLFSLRTISYIAGAWAALG